MMTAKELKAITESCGIRYFENLINQRIDEIEKGMLQKAREGSYKFCFDIGITEALHTLKPIVKYFTDLGYKTRQTYSIEDLSWHIEVEW